MAEVDVIAVENTKGGYGSATEQVNEEEKGEVDANQSDTLPSENENNTFGPYPYQHDNVDLSEEQEKENADASEDTGLVTEKTQGDQIKKNEKQEKGRELNDLSKEGDRDEKEGKESKKEMEEQIHLQESHIKQDESKNHSQVQTGDGEQQQKSKNTKKNPQEEASENSHAEHTELPRDSLKLQQPVNALLDKEKENQEHKQDQEYRQKLDHEHEQDYEKEEQAQARVQEDAQQNTKEPERKNQPKKEEQEQERVLEHSQQNTEEQERKNQHTKEEQEQERVLEHSQQNTEEQERKNQPTKEEQEQERVLEHSQQNTEEQERKNQHTKEEQEQEQERVQAHAQQNKEEQERKSQPREENKIEHKGQSDELAAVEAMDVQAAAFEQIASVETEAAAASKIQSISRRRVAQKFAKRKRKAQSRLHQWAAATLIQANLRRSLSDRVVRERHRYRNMMIKSLTRIQSFARGQRERKQKIAPILKQRVRSLDKERCQLDSELEKLNDAVEAKIKEINDKEVAEAERVNHELSALKAKDKELSLKLKNKQKQFDDAQRRGHELQNVVERMLHGRNDLQMLKNRDYILLQQLQPLKSEHVSLESTLAAQEKAVTTVNIKNQEFQSTYMQLTKELDELKRKNKGHGTVLETHEVSKVGQALRAFQEENAFLTTQLKRCKNGKRPRQSKSFAKQVQKQEAKLTKLSRHTNLLKEEIKKAKQAARVKSKSMNFDMESLRKRSDKIQQAIRVAEQEMEVEREKKMRILKQLGGLRKQHRQVVDAKKDNMESDNSNNPETNSSAIISSKSKIGNPKSKQAKRNNKNTNSASSFNNNKSSPLGHNKGRSHLASVRSLSKRKGPVARR